MLHLYHSNQLESLASQLCEARQSFPASDPLTPETILTPNAGISRWLNFQLAKHDGIAANIDYTYPTTFLWRLYQDGLDNVPEQSSFDRGPLRLRLHGLLEQFCGTDDPVWAPLRRYVKPDGATVCDEKCMQLAFRIADTFNQYLVYRPEMLLDWETGSNALPGDDPMQLWQPALWRELVSNINEPHQAQLWKRFCQRADAGQLTLTQCPAHLHIFNVGLLPPSALDVLMRVADLQAASAPSGELSSPDDLSCARVSLYLHNPSVSHWIDMSASVAERMSDGVNAKWFSGEQQVNPLLESFAGNGHTLIKLLKKRSEGTEKHQEKFVFPQCANNLLNAVQLDLLYPYDQAGSSVSVAINDDDASIQFHQCYSPLREVQALHDHLLDRLNADKTLNPSDIVIMVPDINKFAPIIDAVFSSAGEGTTNEDRARYIPWSIADRSLVEASRVVDCVQRLFELPSFEFEANAVLSFASNQALARNFEFDHEALKTLNEWFQETGIRRTLAGESEKSLDVDKPKWHSFDFGLRRLLFGRAMPSGAKAIGNTLPWTEIDGSQTKLLSELIRFIDLLADTQKHLQEARPIAQWVQSINTIVDIFLLPDEDETDALEQLREVLAELVEDATNAHHQSPISHASFSVLLAEVITGAQRKSYQYMTGRVTLCSMVPLRPVPHRMVCLLGMNDADFPRRSNSLGFDLVSQAARDGDRSSRDDDRFLFLEAALSARDELYMSWVYRNPSDNARREPTVLVTQLQDYIKSRFPHIKSRCIEHPLQPFSQKLFSDAQTDKSADDSLLSFASEWAPPTELPPAVLLTSTISENEDGDEISSNHALPTDQIIGVRDLQRFWRNPSDWYCRRVLGVALWRDEKEPDDAEPFGLDALETYHAREALLGKLLTQGVSDVETECDDSRSAVEENTGLVMQTQLGLSGLLPHGALGEIIFDGLMQGIQKQSQKISDLISLPITTSHVDIDLMLADYRLQGRIHNVVQWQDDNNALGLIHCSTSTLKGRHLVALRLDQCIGAATGILTGKCVVVTRDGNKELDSLDQESAIQELELWLEGWSYGQVSALPFFPNTSAALAQLVDAELSGEKKEIDKAKKKINSSWYPSYGGIPGESDHEAVSLLYPDASAVLERADVKLWAEKMFEFIYGGGV